MNDIQLVEKTAQIRNKVHQEMGKRIIGQKEIIDQILISVVSRGHCLLVGVPGLAKTLMVKTLSEVMDLNFNRIQFTPDLMPSDITGTEVLEEDKTTGSRKFRFVKGPIFSNVLLADEINRTPPKTQAALLEAMQELHVTAAGNTMEIDAPFFVLATQNPIEQEGTYPLPEAQLDRFMFNLKVEYPSKSEELEIARMTTLAETDVPEKVIGKSEILEIQNLLRKVPASQELLQFAIDIVSATRPKTPDAHSFINKWVQWGAGPRATQNLIMGAKANAILHGKPVPEFDDIVAIAHPVLRHRILLNFSAEAEGIDTDEIVTKLIAATPRKSRA